MAKNRLTEGLRKVSEMRWGDFVEIHNSPDATNFDAVISSIVLACRKGTLRAVQEALDRLDGKIATEIDMDHPRQAGGAPHRSGCCRGDGGRHGHQVLGGIDRRA